MPGDEIKIKIPQLKDYNVSEKYGFMLPDPLGTLPEYFQPWESAAKNIIQLLDDGKLRDVVDQMPQLDHLKLASYHEQRLAFVFLTFLANSYVWQERNEGAAKVLPRQLAIPLCALCDILGGQPCLCYPGLALANYTLKDPNGPLHLSNFKPVAYLPGGTDFEWLILIMMQVEIEGTPGIKASIEALEAVKEQDEVGVVKALETMTAAVKKMTEALQRMHEHLHGETFYNVTMPFMAGWDESSELKNGVIYEGVSETPKTVVTSTAAQSSLMYVFDAVLGLIHSPEKQAHLDILLDYMLTPHQDFILALRKCTPVNSFVQSRANDSMAKTFNDCMAACQDFRSVHIQLVVKFVVTQEKKAGSGQDVAQNAIVPYLKGLRDETAEAKI